MDRMLQAFALAGAAGVMAAGAKELWGRRKVVSILPPSPATEEVVAPASSTKSGPEIRLGSIKVSVNPLALMVVLRSDIQNFSDQPYIVRVAVIDKQVHRFVWDVPPVILSCGPHGVLATFSPFKGEIADVDRIIVYYRRPRSEALESAVFARGFEEDRSFQFVGPVKTNLPSVPDLSFVRGEETGEAKLMYIDGFGLIKRIHANGNGRTHLIDFTPRDEEQRVVKRVYKGLQWLDNIVIETIFGEKHEFIYSSDARWHRAEEFGEPMYFKAKWHKSGGLEIRFNKIIKEDIQLVLNTNAQQITYSAPKMVIEGNKSVLYVAFGMPNVSSIRSIFIRKLASGPSYQRFLLINNVWRLSPRLLDDHNKITSHLVRGSGDLS